MAIPTGFPSARLIDPETGDMAVVWRFFLIGLYARTGGGVGAGAPDLTRALAAETAARAAGDVTLGGDVAAQATALGAETAARIAADAALALQLGQIPGAAGGVSMAQLWFGRA